MRFLKYVRAHYLHAQHKGNYFLLGKCFTNKLFNRSTPVGAKSRHGRYLNILFIVPSSLRSVGMIKHAGANAILLLKLITKAHCNIPAGGADAAAVGAVAFVGNVLERCIEREAARELQRCAQVKCEPRR